jgi:hypothetical protein
MRSSVNAFLEGAIPGHQSAGSGKYTEFNDGSPSSYDPFCRVGWYGAPQLAGSIVKVENAFLERKTN